MKCHVYKSLKKGDMYLYLAHEKQLQDLPAALTSMLGVLQFVMDLELTLDRKLARVNVATVMENLAHQGFYLQLPPSDLMPKR